MLGQVGSAIGTVIDALEPSRQDSVHGHALMEGTVGAPPVTPQRAITTNIPADLSKVTPRTKKRIQRMLEERSRHMVSF